MGLVRDGHDRAFEEIVRRYRSSLVTFAGGIVPGDHAEDVVQEALTKAHTALGRGGAEINLRPWLYTIVRNGALNALRDEPVHDHLDESFDGVPQPPDVAARREELAALTARVRGLPDPQREAIVKRELEGRSHEEIASSLGVSAGAVRGLIYRARATLRDGAGILIPVPVLRALLSSGSATPEAAGAAGAAAGLAAGGGGVAVKAGATLGVAVIAVGSGFAIQHRSSRSDDEGAGARIHASRVQDGSGSSGDRVTGLVAGRDGESGNEGPGSGSDDSSGPDGHEGSSGSSSGPGPGSDSGSGSSGEGSGTGDGGESGPSGDDGGDGGIDDGGSSGSGDGGGGVTSGSSDDGGSSRSGSSGSGSSGGDSFETSTSDGGEITTTTTTSDDGGGGSSGSG